MVRLAREAEELTGGLDVLVDNAFQPQPYMPSAQNSGTDLDRSMAVTMKARFLLVGSIGPKTAERGRDPGSLRAAGPGERLLAIISRARYPSQAFRAGAARTGGAPEWVMACRASRAEHGRLTPQHRRIREAVPAESDRQSDVQKRPAGIVDGPRLPPWSQSCGYGPVKADPAD